MKKKKANSILLLTVLGALIVIAVALSLTTEATAAMSKLDICHVTNVPTEGDGHVISIADPAWPAHAEHGDEMIGTPSVTVNEDGTCHASTAPVAVDDAVTTPADTPFTIDVLANDSYVDPIIVSVQSGPSDGFLGPWADGTITYSPQEVFVGDDEFTYQICDSSNLCDTAIVTITVGP